MDKYALARISDDHKFAKKYNVATWILTKQGNIIC